MTTLSSMQMFSIILTVAVCTYFLRLSPFLLFGRKEPSPLIIYLGAILPPAIMASLVIYTMKNISFTSLAGCMPLLLAGLVVAILHLTLRRTLLSILGGTACYMLLVQGPFFL